MQLNRRVEFYVRGSNKPNSPYMTYIAEKGMSSKKVGDKFSMTGDQVKEANKLKGNRVKKYQPVRVFRGDLMEMIAPESMLASEMDSYHVEDQPELDPNAPADVVVEIKNEKGAKSYGGVSINSFTVYEQKNSFNLAGNDSVYARPGEEIYIVKPLDILARIANEYNMSVLQLKLINGLTSNRIQIGQRLRVKKRGGSASN